MRPALDGSTPTPRAPWERAAFTVTAVVMAAGAAFGAVISVGLIVLAIAISIDANQPCDPNEGICENMAQMLVGPAVLAGLVGAAAVCLLVLIARGAWRARGPRTDCGNGTNPTPA